MSSWQNLTGESPQLACRQLWCPKGKAHTSLLSVAGSLYCTCSQGQQQKQSQVYRMNPPPQTNKKQKQGLTNKQKIKEGSVGKGEARVLSCITTTGDKKSGYQQQARYMLRLREDILA